MTRIALLGVFALGLSLRLYGLGFESLWYDELWSWRITDGSLAEVWSRTREDTGPPGHHLLLFFTRQLAGSSEVAIRLPSALLGALAPLAMFSLGRKLYGEREGLLAAGLVAVLWAPVFYSREARAYSGLLLLSILASSAWVTLMRDLEPRGPRPPRASLNAARYAFAGVALAYFHYFGILLIGLQALAATVHLHGERRALGYAAAIYAVIGLACLPWLPAFLFQLEGGMGNIAWIREVSPGSLVTFALALFNERAIVAVPAFLLIAAYLGVRVARRAAGWASLANPDVLLASWLIVPVAVTALASWLWTPTFLDRYLLIVAPAAYLLVARALLHFSGPPRSQGVVSAIALGLCVFHLLGIRAFYLAPRKAQLREAVAYATLQTPEQGSVYILTRGWNPWMLDYYADRAGARVVGGSSVGTRLDRAALQGMSAAIARSIHKQVRSSGASTTWVFEAGRNPVPSLTAAFGDHFEALGRSQLSRVTVSVYASRAGARE